MRKNVITKQAIFYMFVLAALVMQCAIVNPPEKTALRQSLYSIAITEINYNPIAQDNIDGDEFEFIELKNIGSTVIALNDVSFSDGIQFSFDKNASVNPGAFIILASNSTSFAKKYGFSPYATYTGKLSNTGEKISLIDNLSGEIFLSIEYSDKSPWPGTADGSGRSLVPFTTDTSQFNKNNASCWRASYKTSGSPGRDDPSVVVINEILTHTDLPQLDAVELYNPNSGSVDIGNWFITDRHVDPMKFRIPAGTTIPAHGYIVFDETSFSKDTSAASFRFSENGEEAYLFADSTGLRSGNYYHGVTFGVIENGYSFGRLVTSDGKEHIVKQKANSLGAENRGPLICPVVFTEVMYHPVNSMDEFVELKNITDTAVALFDPLNPKNCWKIDGINFTFPENTTLNPGEVVLIISNSLSEADFRTHYTVPANTRLFVKIKDLTNSGDKLLLSKPAEPYIDSASSMQVVVPYITQEYVNFKNSGDWPVAADGTGFSLQRKSKELFADDPKSWSALSPTPGVN